MAGLSVPLVVAAPLFEGGQGTDFSLTTVLSTITGLGLYLQSPNVKVIIIKGPMTQNIGNSKFCALRRASGLPLLSLHAAKDTIVWITVAAEENVDVMV